MNPLRMNRVQVCNFGSQPQKIPPATPNLEQAKLHGNKQKSRKKTQFSSIQPKMQPHLSIANVMKVCSCGKQPDRRDKQTSQKCCMACNLGRQDEALIEEESMNEDISECKKQAIEDFMARVCSIRETMESRKAQMIELFNEHEHSYSQYFNYLNTSFAELLTNLQEKHHELNNSLIECIEKRKRSTHASLNFINRVKESIQRYVFDINKHYEDILEELEMGKFQEIMEQYHAKIDYYSQNLDNCFSMRECEQINVYLPLSDLKKWIDKASVNCYEKDNYLLPRSVKNQRNRGGSSSRNTRHDNKENSRLMPSQPKKKHGLNVPFFKDKKMSELGHSQFYNSHSNIETK